MAFMIARRSFVLLALAACSRAPRFLDYNGPEVTQIRVYKTERRMELMHDAEVLRSYDIGLGFAPAGHKQRYGDGRTPEGEYTIDRRNPQSLYHLSLGISYPNEQDRARAEAAGEDPGGDIFIHGRGRGNRFVRGDWTVGCIAVTDSEIEEIYSMVQTGTPIVIYP
ncbi:MAG TPA: L,D-transpeptidase family protein [Pararhodobacter sp.]|uniref:L,D-transpeptidase family protein n=1 Tax=Pararhodobacter sp. TaxID=2127056 RepID=UPI002C42269F|nr:L,D-transpeptidase family protein [Pararhodobacter sp.]HPD92207.1 L,D-transpeptidase family protein [Pararhodobacter sp.]